MNIAFYDPTNWPYGPGTPRERALGGSQSALCYLALALAERGHTVDVFNGIRKPTIAEGVTCRPSTQMASLASKRKWDAVIVLNGAVEIEATIRAHMRVSSKLVLWTQHSFDHGAMTGFSDPAAATHWDQIVFVSNWQRREFLRRYSLPEGRCFEIYNAIAPAFERLFESVEGLATAKSAAPILAYTSTPFRGLGVLLHAFVNARNRFPELQLRVYSSMSVYWDEAANARYARIYDACRRTPGITYIGSMSQPDLAQSLRQASFLAYPSTYRETFCTTAHEALAAGLRVVTVDLGALAETTLGHAACLPLPAVPDSMEDFRHRYTEWLCREVQEWLDHRAGFFHQRFEQSIEVGRKSTWRNRAHQWERLLYDQSEARATRRQ